MSLARPASHAENLSAEDYAYKYLVKYGYMPTSSESDESGKLQSLSEAVSEFQSFAGINTTGVLDDVTMEMMHLRRCGVKDNVVSRNKRFALQGSRWRNRNLKNKIGKYPIKSKLTRRQVDEAMEEAFNVWSNVTNLTFEKIFSGDAHIEIRFETSSHGDDDPFDGEGGTLAHAFFPVFGGDAHFDDEEDWTVNTHRGTSLLMTASHELGHSLGLSHSNVRSSLMAPFYRGYDANLSLEEDDIRGIQALYGEKSGTSSNEVAVRSNFPSVTTTRRPTTTSARTTRRPSFSSDEDKDLDNKALCISGKLDTMVTMKDSVTYAFLGDQYWKLTETSVEPGYPRSTSADWDGLPGNLDASFTWTNGKTYFFKGSKYWRFSDVGKMDV